MVHTRMSHETVSCELLMRAVLFVAQSPDRYLVAVRSLLERTTLPVRVGVLYPQDGPRFDGLGERVSWRTVGSVAELINTEMAGVRSGTVDLGPGVDAVVVIDDAVLFPPNPFAAAQLWLETDVRIATVSFLSNAADFLSFPIRNASQDRPPDRLDEESITRRLRTKGPPAEPAPIVHATGAVVVIGAAAFGAIGELRAPHSARFDAAIADFSARGRAKGFVDVVDASTYITRPSDVAVAPIANALSSDDRGWLLHHHRSLIAFLDKERMHGDSPLGLAHQCARAKVCGLRVAVDGSCFGPNEVGTQVATQQLIAALAERDDVNELVVVVAGPVPPYAANTLAHPRVRVVRGLGEVGSVDVAYRPYQPIPGWDVGGWRASAPRLVIGMLDTIAFHNGGYFNDSEAWIAYRSAIQTGLLACDAVTVISEDVISQMRMHRLPVPSIVVAIALGTDHLTGREPAVMPSELAARGFAGAPFALVQGVNYTHKNRELAMAAHRLLWDRGFDDLGLVVAGASVPHGTSRVAEAALGLGRDRMWVLPELGPEERNWLLRHAQFVWYPTSAEGFGLVPFEAARFGTPTVTVGFGPIAEVTAPADVLFAGGWDAGALADAAERLLTDPGAARAQVAALLARADQYSWALHAERLTGLFRRVLAEPQRHPPTTG